jgi:hypothetical protein
LLGWAEQEDSEDVTLIFSPIDPCEDYDAAQQARVYICASHIAPAGN